MGAGTIGLKAVFTADDKITSSVIRMQSAVIGFTDSASKGLGKLDAVNDKVWGGLKTAATALGGLGLGAGVVAKNVIDAGADFEQAITNVGAVSLMTREQVAPLEALAKKLGATTKFSATEVAGAMEMMGKAGFDNGQIIEGVGGILSAAAADGAGLEETASNISNVLKGMGLETTETARVADVLTLASARTNSSIASLGESMANVSSTARQLGVPLEDTVAMVAMLQDVGLNASEAGSALSTMLTKLAAPSKEASQQMAAMGVKFQDASGNMLAPTKVLEQLVKAGQKAGGNMKQVAFFADLVGMRGQKAALNLKDLFKAGKVTALIDELEGAAGSAEKMSSIRMDTFKGDLETLGGSVDSLKISLFDMQSGPLRGVVQGMTEWLDANSGVIASGINDFIDESIPILQNFGEGVKDAFVDALPMIKGFGSALSTLFGNDSAGPRMQAYLWGRDIANLGISFVKWSVGIKVAQMAIWGIGNAMKIARGIAIAYHAISGFLSTTMGLYTAVTTAGAGSTVAMGTAMTAASVSAGSLAVTEEAAAVAAFELESAAIGAAAAEAGVATASVGAAGGIASVGAAAAAAAIPIAAAAAALAALYAAYDQNEKLKKESGGKGILDVAAGLMAGKGLKEIADEGLDEQAREEARQRNASAVKFSETTEGAPAAAVYDKIGMPAAPAAGSYANAFGMPTPVGMAPPTSVAPPVGMAPPVAAPPPTTAAPGITPDTLRAAVKNSLEVTVKSTDGTTAEVTKKPAGTKVNLQPSGAP